MQFDVSIISTNEYIPDEIIVENIPESYLYDDNGNLCFASTLLNSEREVTLLVNFLFGDKVSGIEVYRDKHTYILDLSENREQLIDLNNLEQNYQKWIAGTGRENTMNEYGVLLDFIGFAKNGMNKKYLLIIVSNKRHCS